LGFHSFEEDFRLIVSIRILDRRKFVTEGLVKLESESSLHFSGEIRMSVRQHIDIKVQFEETVKTIAVTDDSALDSHGIFFVGLNSNRVLVFVELSEVGSVNTILVDHLGVSIKESYSEGVLVVSSNLVVKSLLSTVVSLSSEVQGLVGTWSWDLHSVQKCETTRVSGGVGDEVVTLTRLADLIIILEKAVNAGGGDFRLRLKGRRLLNGISIVVFRPETVVLVHVKVVLESENIKVRSSGALPQGVSSGGESIGPTGPVVIAVSHEEAVVSKIGVVEGVSERDSH
jgi:hypothetical protein